ncbi:MULTISPECIES: DUF3263 domain-containing protein [Corynebacterium]|uniref:DUF3263 domain-containing protein n=1 Tax=Corynebacterium TaxID=1716 RepID=UPI00124CCBC3|nr:MULTISPECIES: DUF3263 domain-containing protein [Corynebacterium]MBV7282621.1 DUF3263 domain-containing protein [Corynebacterium sp. TAE3-ERU30]MBV7302030.1 DUF3263 domain-containing protein [Corynebacterium sp. TAE3-ERU2]
MSQLSEHDKAILELEKKRFVQSGRKEEAIRSLGTTPVRYYQRLNELIDLPLAAEREPLLIARLRRLRERRS